MKFHECLRKKSIHYHCISPGDYIEYVNHMIYHM